MNHDNPFSKYDSLTLVARKIMEQQSKAKEEKDDEDPKYSKVKGDSKHDKTDDGEGMDPVGKGDADIDNDGDTDDSDEYLHKRRKAIKKSVEKDDDEDSKEIDEAVNHKRPADQKAGEKQTPKLKKVKYAEETEYHAEVQRVLDEMAKHKKKVKEDDDEENGDDEDDKKLLAKKKDDSNDEDGEQGSDDVEPNDDEKKGDSPVSAKDDDTVKGKKKPDKKKDVIDVDPEEPEQTGIQEEMTDSQMKKREDIVKSMKKKMGDFENRYGKNAKNVMYATASKLAQREGFSMVSEEVFWAEAKEHTCMNEDCDCSHKEEGEHVCECEVCECSTK